MANLGETGELVAIFNTLVLKRMSTYVWGAGCASLHVCVYVEGHMCTCAGGGDLALGEIQLPQAAAMSSPALAGCVVPMFSGAWLPGGKRLG